MSNVDRALVLEAAQIKLAQMRLLDFATRIYPGFTVTAHIEYLADLLERVERGELTRLIVSLHPGSGKSTLLQLFSAWFLGRNGGRKIIGTYSAERLFFRNYRAIRI